MKQRNGETNGQRDVLLDNLSSHYGFFYTVSQRLEKLKTPFQTLELVHSQAFGKVLLLDGATQVVEFGEQYYHEPLAHFPLLRLSDDQLQKVLVLGGGDGGILREVLRHPLVETAELVELDEAVVKYCQKHFPKINDGAFDSEKTTVFFEDANVFVQKAIKTNTKRYDAVIMDMTDPEGPSRVL